MYVLCMYVCTCMYVCLYVCSNAVPQDKLRSNSYQLEFFKIENRLRNRNLYEVTRKAYLK